MGQRTIVIVGGGIIGLSIAEALTRRGLKPVIVEKGDFTREASWAGAGYLSLKAAALSGGPFFDLSVFSLRLYDQWVELLQDESGIDIEFQRGGHLEVALSPEEDAELKAQALKLQSSGVPVALLTGADARAMEPNLSPKVVSAFQMPEGAQVRSPRLNRAILKVLMKRNVQLRDQTPVNGFLTEGRRVVGVKTPAGEIRAEAVVLASGAWSGHLSDRLGLRLPVKPIRGQVVLFTTAQPLLNRALFTPQAYLVPRLDGHMFIGSTFEDVGFNKGTTLEGVNYLEEAAYRAVPKLRLSRMESRWAGLRPGTPDGKPFLGPAPGIEGLVYACGHQSHGILLAPATGVLIDQVLHGEEPDVPLEAFAANRSFESPVG